MNILVLGGTRFLGRAIVDAAMAGGHEVTLFNRGLSAPGLYPELVTIVGDRTQDLSPLDGWDFDAVIDVAGYEPAVVRRSADAFADRAGRYTFVSTVSVYADQDTPSVETSVRLAPSSDGYGESKVACEDVVTEVYGDRAFVPRPGLIVGPNDKTERFGYWPWRLARGGRVLVPGDPADPQQFIDVRDLGAWIVAGTVSGLAGAFNAVGEPTPFGALIDVCVAAAGEPAEVVWVPSDALVKAGVSAGEGVPLWLAAYPGWKAANLVVGDKARAAGLTTRPLTETVADTLAWENGWNGRKDVFPAAEEKRLLDLLT
jgi:2'-hydroxyisoflavone reductase